MTSDGNFRIESITDAIISNNLIRLAVECWKKLHTNAKLPKWSDFDSLDEPELIPHSFLIDVTRKNRLFRFTIHMVGSQVAQYYGDVTGVTLDAEAIRLVADERAAVRSHQILTMAAEQRQPLVGHGNVSFHASQTSQASQIELVALPFADDAGNISAIVLVVWVYSDKDKN